MAEGDIVAVLDDEVEDEGDTVRVLLLLPCTARRGVEEGEPDTPGGGLSDGDGESDGDSDTEAVSDGEGVPVGVMEVLGVRVGVAVGVEVTLAQAVEGMGQKGGRAG